jgi:hydroxymethylbilane synthase
MAYPKTIRLGTRGSPLALRQTEMVRTCLARVVPGIETEVVVIHTSGDWDPAQGETRLAESEGGKGLFAKEIEAALLKGEIDAGVHSMKDMESHLPKGLIIDQMLAREDARDCFIFKNLSNSIQSLDNLPKGMVIGTSSVRRAAFLKARRPDIRIVPLRGNVETRLGKLRKGEQGMEGIVMAYAGLKRLGLEKEVGFIVGIDDMLPSAGQGAVGIEISQNSQKDLSIFSQISDLKTVLCVKAERAALAVLDGSCHTPIGAHAWLEQGTMHLRVAVVSEDGRERFFEEARDAVADIRAAEQLGRVTGESLKVKIPSSLLQ